MINRFKTFVLFVIACTICACSASVNGGVKTANDESEELGDPRVAALRMRHDAEVRVEARKATEKGSEPSETDEATSEPDPKSEPEEISDPLGPDLSLFGGNAGGMQLPSGLLISQAVQGAGASPPNCLKGNGRCAGFVNVTPEWLLMQIGDIIVTDMVTPTGIQLARPGLVTMMGGEQVMANVAFIPPNPYGRRTPANPGIASLEIACVSASNCPNRVSLVLRAYQKALSGEMVPTGKCYSTILAMPSPERWGHHVAVYPTDLRPCS